MCEYQKNPKAFIAGIPLKNEMYPKYTGDHNAYTGNDPGSAKNNYPWIITPYYNIVNDEIKTHGYFTIYHKNFGRFLDAYTDNKTGGPVVTRIGITNTRLWFFIDDKMGKKVDTIKPGDYRIEQASSARYLDAYNNVNGNRAVTRPNVRTDTRIWTLEEVKGEPDTFTIKQKKFNRYLSAEGNLLTTVKVLGSGFLSGIVESNNPIKFNSFMCQKGYDDLYNEVSGGDKVTKDCCGSPVISKPASMIEWTKAIKSFPCISSIPIKSNYWFIISEGQFRPRNVNKQIKFNYQVDRGVFGDCLRNWNNVFNDTQRIPCQPYAWFPDPERPGQFRQIPIPRETFEKCLEYQKRYILTPNKNVEKGQPVCPISIKKSPIGIGFDPQTPSIDVSALNYCLCNCKNFGVSDSDCENICKNDPALKNYKDATDVWTGGWYYDSNSKNCKKTTNVQNGEFLSENACKSIIDKSPIPKPGPGPGPSPGPGPAPTPTINPIWTYLGIGLIVLLLLIGIIVDIKRAF